MADPAQAPAPTNNVSNPAAPAPAFVPGSAFLLSLHHIMCNGWGELF